MFIQNYMTADPNSIYPSASADEAWEWPRTGRVILLAPESAASRGWSVHGRFVR